MRKPNTHLGLEAHSIPMWVFPVETDGLVLLVILGFYLFIYFYAFIISFIQLNQPNNNNNNKGRRKFE